MIEISFIKSSVTFMKNLAQMSNKTIKSLFKSNYDFIWPFGTKINRIYLTLFISSVNFERTRPFWSKTSFVDIPQFGLPNLPNQSSPSR